MSANSQPDPWPDEQLEYVTACPLCESSARTLLYDHLRDVNERCAPGEWSLWRCDGCRIAYLDPRPNVSSIDKAYATYFTHKPVGSSLSGRKKYTKRLLRALANGYRKKVFVSNAQPAMRLGYYLAHFAPYIKRTLDRETRAPDLFREQTALDILDVGCGNGAYLALAKSMGHHVYGVEPDPVARTLAETSGINVLGSYLDDVPATFRHSFDLITLSHVIEHVHDPLGLLTHCHRLLKRNGTLWLETPNVESYGAAHYGASWRDLDPPRHLFLFTASALVALLNRAGFASASVLPARPVWREVYKASETIKRESRPRLRRPTYFTPPAIASVIWTCLRGRRATRLNPLRAEFLTITARPH